MRLFMNGSYPTMMIRCDACGQPIRDLSRAVVLTGQDGVVEAYHMNMNQPGGRRCEPAPHLPCYRLREFLVDLQATGRFRRQAAEDGTEVVDEQDAEGL